MESGEIVGYSREDFAAALEVMESTIDMGQKARITICTEGMPTEEELDYIFLGMVETGCHVSRPTAGLVEGIPTTQFLIQKGSPQWQVIIPVLVPIFLFGLIAFGITKIESIAKALGTIMVIGFLGLIILAVVLRKPAEKYIERGGTLPRLPETTQKRELEPVNVDALERNIELVFKSGDIRKLNKPTYSFIITSMHFIAHYDLGGFQATYSDLREFSERLQTSEYSDELDYNLKWANKFETDPDYTRMYGRAYVTSVASAIRKIVGVARKYYPRLFAETATKKALAAR